MKALEKERGRRYETANGLAMYACLYSVLGQAGFPLAPAAARNIGFLLPVAAFVLACWARREVLRGWAQVEETADIAHLPRFAR